MFGIEQINIQLLKVNNLKRFIRIKIFVKVKVFRKLEIDGIKKLDAQTKKAD